MTSLREPGAVLLLSCYELGHQPLGLAWPKAFLERAGYAPATIDLAVEALDESTLRQARLIAIADRKSTRLNSSHSQISYAVFCLKKKKKTELRDVEYR